MTSISIPVSEELKAQVEARAAEGGYANVEAYVETVLRAAALGGPDGLGIGSEEELEALLLSRMDGPWVEMDDPDFARIRAKVQDHLDRDAGKS